MTVDRRHFGHDGDGYFDGQLLVAMPTIGDPRFQRSVIYLCAHSPAGAWGLIVNRRSRRLTLPDLLVKLEVVGEDEAARLPEPVRQIPVMRGGPVETGRGFVLHSDDYFAEKSSIELDEGFALTASVEILRAIAAGVGPRRAMLALGYAGWAPGQLDQEIQANGWLTSQCAFDFLFETPCEERYDAALARIGVDPALLSSEAGRA